MRIGLVNVFTLPFNFVRVAPRIDTVTGGTVLFFPINLVRTPGVVIILANDLNFDVCLAGVTTIETGLVSVLVFALAKTGGLTTTLTGGSCGILCFVFTLVGPVTTIVIILARVRILPLIFVGAGATIVIGLDNALGCPSILAGTLATIVMGLESVRIVPLIIVGLPPTEGVRIEAVNDLVI